MVDINKLKEEELNQLNDKSKVELGEEEWDLEELILLGDDKKIPILIEYPKPDGKRVKAKALIKQLTINEIDTVKTKQENQLQAAMLVLQKALFKSNGEPFSKNELKRLPIGVLTEISDKILEISGINEDTKQELINF